MSASDVIDRTIAYRLPPAMHVGHVHLRVADLERSLAFYRDILGLHINQDFRADPTPRQVAMLSSNDYHHYVAIAEFPNVTPVTSKEAGLFHIAFLYPSRREFALAVKNILDRGYPIDTYHEYGPGEAVNLRDPDGIPLELYWDRPASEWPRVDCQLRVYNKRIDAATILAALDDRSPA